MIKKINDFDEYLDINSSNEGEKAMREKIKDMILVLLLIGFFMFIPGFVLGLSFGSDYNNSSNSDSFNKRVKDICNTKPQSIMGYIFYPLKLGEKAGCFLSKPRFNLDQK